jgi:hypothetical protein
MTVVEAWVKFVDPGPPKLVRNNFWILGKLILASVATPCPRRDEKGVCKLKVVNINTKYLVHKQFWSFVTAQ